MHWMCVTYGAEPALAGREVAGPGWDRRGVRPADPWADAAHCSACPHRHCRDAAGARTCLCYDGLPAGIAA